MSGLRNVAYIEIDIGGGDRTGVFEIREDLERTSDIDKQYLMSNRGAQLREIWDIGADLLPDEVADADLENRRGYHVDGGAGSYTFTVSGTATKGDRWGDGSAPTGDYSKYDASGADLEVMHDVLDWYVSQSKSDSSGGTRLHVGEWCDGTYASDPGVFGDPMPVAINSSNVTHEDASGIEVTIELTWTSMFPDTDLVGSVQQGLEEIGDWIPDF